MQVLLAVVEDLYTFAVSMLFPWRTGSKNADGQLYLPASRVLSPLRESTEIDAYRGGKNDVLHEIAYAVPTDGAHPQKHTIVYCAQATVPLRERPESAADTVIATLSYGDMIMALDANSEWSHVAIGNKRGYVPTQTLAQKAGDVYPTFTIGAENGAHESSTVRLRLVIKDEFGAGFSQLPLQGHEYVYYKLLRRGTRIAWPDVRPRTAGAWATILSTLDGVTITDRPIAGAIMEFTASNEKAEGKGRLAYVEKVFPDQSIQISEANWPDRGVYNERVLTPETWHALNPAFITIG